MKKWFFYNLLLFIIGCSSSIPTNYELGLSEYENKNYTKALEYFSQSFTEGDNEDLSLAYISKLNDKLQPKIIKKVESSSKSFLCSNITLVEINSNLISGEFVEQELREVLLELSSLSETAIVYDESIQGVISAKFDDITLNEALDIVLSPNNFDFKRYNNHIIVGDSSLANPTFHLLSSSCSYRPRFQSPEKIVRMVSSFYKEYISFDDDYVIITAPRKIMKRLRNDIENIDREPKQILLELTIIEVNTKGKRIFEMTWNRKDGDRSIENGNDSITYSVAKTSVRPTLDASLKLINKTENGVVRASPKIVTLNGHKATYSTSSSFWSQINNTKFIENNYGIKLVIRPTLNYNHRKKKTGIVLDISKAEVSDHNAGKIITHSLSTKVKVDNEETLVIGGLLHRKTVNKESEIPLLGRIPILGWLFRDFSKSKEESEVIIFIKPKILS